MIQKKVAEHSDIRLADMTSKRRPEHIAFPRQIAMYLCRELTDLSLPKIGERFGGRDHSTVVFAVNKVKTQMKERESWYEQVRELTTRIRQQAARG